MTTRVHHDLQPERLLQIYRAEPLRRLLALQQALYTARQRATTQEQIAWCDSRLPLVESIIAEKQRR